MTRIVILDVIYGPIFVRSFSRAIYDCLSLYMLRLRGTLFPIKCDRRYIPPKSGTPADMKNVFHDGTIAIPALGLRPSHVRSIPIPELYASQCQHVRHPSWDQLPEFSQRADCNSRGNGLNFVLVLMRIPFFRYVGDRAWDAGVHYSTLSLIEPFRTTLLSYFEIDTALPIQSINVFINCLLYLRIIERNILLLSFNLIYFYFNLI